MHVSRIKRFHCFAPVHGENDISNKRFLADTMITRSEKPDRARVDTTYFDRTTFPPVFEENKLQFCVYFIVSIILTFTLFLVRKYLSSIRESPRPTKFRSTLLFNALCATELPFVPEDKFKFCVHIDRKFIRKL